MKNENWRAGPASHAYHSLRGFWPWPLCLDYGWTLVRSVREALADFQRVRELGGAVPEELLRSLRFPAPPAR
jgi:hypothetical protein